ncbi:Tim10/DDP family zinc finger [Cooperia oncophora]
MMFPGGVGSSELQQAAAEKVKRDIGTFFIFGFLIEAGMDTTDPQMARFLQQLQSETQRQKFTEQVHTLTGRCWDVCFADYRPPSKLDGALTIASS